MKRKRNWSKIIKRSFLFSFIFGLLWFFGANWAIESNAEGKVFDQVSDCPEVKVALVLGTSRLLKHGNDNLYFSYRIKAAVELYRAGKVQYILVSGDNGTTTYDEPTDMKNALIAAGIPAKRIYLDYAGFRTLDSMERALKVFNQKEVIVVSQRFHNERAIYLGEHFGMTVYGYNAKDVAKMNGFKTKVRERFARMKVFWDILFGVDSKFLGPQVKIG
ncbi:SanA/YdcF family protein [Fluviicola chungangensis]|uniref:Vancomycin high temperature exclusion protein n=1 Tax=Fluviicola chungangensis TaxID=2597671 RepID=A0A556N7S5_9FLAO|nr:ElyC/SanA/YdcF family protein [Fluviicola chungangensis]TSJ48161.1 vancomycin high temperature exclusion protein [Fluviicola chungangensis]